MFFVFMIKVIGLILDKYYVDFSQQMCNNSVSLPATIPEN
jgi:hypothetical protein